MKKVKNVLAILFSIVITGCSFACDSGAGTGALPEWTDNKEMLIGGWDSPINTLADYQLAKDMGLTHLFIDQSFARRGTSAYEEILGFCEEVGIKAIVSLGNAEQHETTQTDETDYSEFPAVDMINYWDEP